MSEPRELTGAEIIIQSMLDNGTEVVFGYPGGAVLPVYDALFKQNKLRHILVRHEQGAGHAAEGYARATGKCGVMMVTSGPGATNTVTALADALMDSIPLVCVTGQVPTHLIGTDAFQEADVVGITRSATKHNYLVKNVNDLGRIMHEAFHVAMSGRPGPVLVDVPKDVLNAVGMYRGGEGMRRQSYNPVKKADAKMVERAVELMARAKKPLFYVGGGLVNAGTGACDALVKFAHMTGFPVTTTLMGPRRVSRDRQAVPRHAGDAWFARGEHVHERVRCDDQSRRAVRRPGDGAARCVLTEVEEDPCRYRRQLDQ